MWTLFMLLHNQNETLPLANVLLPRRLGSGIEKLKVDFPVRPSSLSNLLRLCFCEINAQCSLPRASLLLTILLQLVSTVFPFHK